MLTHEVITLFGSQHAVAEKLGIKQPSVANWGAEPPHLRQLQIEALTGGALKASSACDQFRVKPAPRKRAQEPAKA